MWYGKKIPGHERYSISNFGEVINNSTGRILKKNIMGRGYWSFKSCINGRYINLYIHRIVAICFVANHNNYNIVNHIDGDKKNNFESNLEWCTPDDNRVHAIQNNLIKHGEDAPRAKLSKNDVFVYPTIT